MKVVVCSSTTVKVQAVESLLGKILGGKIEYTVKGIEAASGVSETPLSIEETKQGAINRIYNTTEPADYYIGIESGVEREFDTYYAFTFAAVADKTKNRYGFGTSTKFPLPDEFAMKIEDGVAIKTLINNEDGLVASATGALIKRSDLVSEAVSVALIPFHFYPVPFPENAPKELLKYVPTIKNPIELNNLASQISQLDFRDQKLVDTNAELGELVAPPEPTNFDEYAEDVYQNGVEAIREGEVAVVILSGGQGTRLAAPVPKGMMELDIPSHSTLLEIQLRRVRKLITMFSKHGQFCKGIPVYILTSDATHSPIAAYLLKNKNFGVPHVMLVKQRTLPARSPDGHFLLKNHSSVLHAPNGNGAVFQCLKDSGALADMRKLGVKYVDIHAIDNCLARPADPFFVGAMIFEEGDAAIKVLRKTTPAEKIGTVCQRNGKTVVVEYSEIPADKSAAFMLGNICLHLFAIEVLERAAKEELPYHVAIKREPCVQENGEIAVGEVHKFERFIFDALEFANKVVLMQIPREEQFAPLKNASGAPTDSPETARDLLLGLHRKWAEAAGAKFEGEGPFELTPETTYAGEGLEELGFSDMTFTLPMKY